MQFMLRNQSPTKRKEGGGGVEGAQFSILKIEKAEGQSFALLFYSLNTKRKKNHF